MLNFIRNSIDRIGSILLVLLFCQFPLFIEQYEMRLSGHLQESSKLIQDLEKNAAATNKSLQGYIQKFLQQDDPDFASSGATMQKSVQRYENLTKAYAALHDASLFKRPFVFLAYLQSDIFRESLHEFTPGFSITLETLLYGIIGFFVWMALFQLTCRLSSRKKINSEK